MSWDTIADDATINTTISALKANGIDGIVVVNGEEAKKKALELIPEGAEIFNATSVTLNVIGLDNEITTSGKFKAVRNTLEKMDRKTQNLEMQKLGAAPEWVIGSVQAVTQEGQVLIASNTGSQLPAYVYGSAHVIWVVGAQKIVNDISEGIKRIYEHILPLESARARKAYGLPEDWNSFVSKLLIFNREIKAGRVTIILVREKLGF